jgi:hypothetical protein
MPSTSMKTLLLLLATAMMVDATTMEATTTELLTPSGWALDLQCHPPADLPEVMNMACVQHSSGKLSDRGLLAVANKVSALWSIQKLCESDNVGHNTLNPGWTPYSSWKKHLRQKWKTLMKNRQHNTLTTTSNVVNNGVELMVGACLNDTTPRELLYVASEVSYLLSRQEMPDEL